MEIEEIPGHPRNGGLYRPYWKDRGTRVGGEGLRGLGGGRGRRFKGGGPLPGNPSHFRLPTRSILCALDHHHQAALAAKPPPPSRHSTRPSPLFKLDAQPLSLFSPASTTCPLRLFSTNITDLNCIWENSCHPCPFLILVDEIDNRVNDTRLKVRQNEQDGVH